MAGLVSKAGSTENSSGILDLGKQAAGSGILNDLGGFLGNDNSNLLEGAEMLKGIFGDRTGIIASLVAGFGGIKHSSASSILCIAAPVALGVLGKHANDNNLNAGGLMSFLLSQKNVIVNALPPALGSIAGLPGLGATGNTVTSVKTPEAVHTTDHYAVDAVENQVRM